MYGRRWKDERYLIVISFSDNNEKIKVPKGYDLNEAELLLSNYNDTDNIDLYSDLRPYEVRLFKSIKEGLTHLKVPHLQNNSKE